MRAFSFLSPRLARTGIKGQREEQRTGQSEDDRQRHRPEQSPLDSLEKQYGQVDDQDNQLTEHRGLAHLERCVSYDVELGPRAPLSLQTTNTVLDDDDRAIDDQPKIDGPEAEKAGRDTELQHRAEREQHRERNRRRNDESSAEVSEEHEEHGDDKQRALEQVLADGSDDAVHKLGAVVEHLDPHVVWKTLARFLEALSQPVGDLVAVLTHEHEPEAENDFSRAVRRDRSTPNLMAFANRRNVTDANRNALMLGNDDAFELGDAPRETNAVNQVQFPCGRYDPAPYVLVVVSKRLNNVVEGQLVLEQPQWLDYDVVLPFPSAPSVDFSNTRDRQELGAQDPVVQRRQLRESVAVSLWSA